MVSLHLNPQPGALPTLLCPVLCFLELILRDSLSPRVPPFVSDWKEAPLEVCTTGHSLPPASLLGVRSDHLAICSQPAPGSPSPQLQPYRLHGSFLVLLQAWGWYVIPASRRCSSRCFNTPYWPPHSTQTSNCGTFIKCYWIY